MLHAKGRTETRSVGLVEADMENLKVIQGAMVAKDGRALSISMILRRALGYYRQVVERAVADGTVADELRAVLAVHGRKGR